MTKSASTSKTLRKQYTSELHNNALKLAKRIGTCLDAKRVLPVG
jgi:hypothetical protein